MKTHSKQAVLVLQVPQDFLVIFTSVPFSGVFSENIVQG